MRLRPALCCLAFLILPHGGRAQVSSDPRSPLQCERSRWEDTVRSVSAGGEVALASGRVLKLLDVRLPPEEAGTGRARAWLTSLVGRRVAVAALMEGTDRWGREAGDVALLDEAIPIDVAELLVGEGFAIVDAGDKNGLCRRDLLRLEQRARARRLGLWSSDRHSPVPASDLPRLRALIGQFALVEGVVRGVGERRERTYLNFGRDWTQDLTITIPKRTWAILRERGLSAAGLKGRRVRARGVLEEWQGVAVEITAADMIEVLGQDVTRP